MREVTVAGLGIPPPPAAAAGAPGPHCSGQGNFKFGALNRQTALCYHQRGCIIHIIIITRSSGCQWRLGNVGSIMMQT